MLWGQPWSCYWGDPENWIIVLDANDFISGCAITFKAITNYPQYFQFILDGKQQGAPIYLGSDETFTVTGDYSYAGTSHVYSIVGQGLWATGVFDATQAGILFMSTRANRLHAEILAAPELFSIADDGQFTNWAIDDGAVRRFENCQPNAYRPTWGELDITMSTDTGVHTVTAALNGVSVAEGSRTGNGALTLDSQNNLGVSFTVTLTYTGDITDDAKLIAAFPSQYNVFSRSSGGAWGAGDFPAISAASWLANVATVTIGAHSLLVGATIFISGVNPAGYNGLYTITVVTATTVSYALTTNPGAYVAGGMSSPPTAVIYDDGHSGGYAYNSAILAAGTYYALVHQVNSEGEESTGTTNGTVTIVGVPDDPTSIALSNPVGDVISWTSPNAGYTYNIYDSGITGVIPSIVTTTHAAGTGTLTKSLSALAAFTGTRYVLVRSVSAGVESANAEALQIQYVAGVAQLVVPNTPFPSQQVTTVGLQMSVGFSLSTSMQAIAATSVELFAALVGDAFNYAAPIGTLDLTVAANYVLADLRIYGTIVGIVGSDGEYNYAIRANSANGQDTNTNSYGPIRLTTAQPSDPVFSIRGGV